MRPLLTALRLALPLMVVVAGQASADDPTLALAPTRTLTYDVLRAGERIGTQTVSFEHMGGELTVRTETNLGFTAYWIFDVTWAHQSVEIWGNDGLKQFTSFTNNDGKQRKVHAQRDGEHLVVNGNGDERELPADLLPGTLWHPETVSQRQVLDPIKGRLRKVSIANRGLETIEVEGRRIEARHYAMRGELKRDIWYDQNGTVVKVELPIDDGSEVTLVLR